MDIKQLEYFVHVAELRSFTRASVVLGVAQPALSRQVRMLEVELRQSLLLRNGRGVSLTEAGQLLLKHARGLLHQFAHTKEQLAQLRGAVSSRIALGLPPSLSRILTVPLAREFRDALPNSALSIREGLSAAMLDALKNGFIDAALIYETAAVAPSAELTFTPVCDEDLYLIQRMGDQDTTGSVSLQELAARPLVVPSRPNVIRMEIEMRLAAAGLAPTIAFEIDSVTSLLDLVAGGIGEAVLPLKSLRTCVHADQLIARPMRERAMRLRLLLAENPQRAATHAHQAMLALILKTAQAVLSQ